PRPIPRGAKNPRIRGRGGAARARSTPSSRDTAAQAGGGGQPGSRQSDVLVSKQSDVLVSDVLVSGKQSLMLVAKQSDVLVSLPAGSGRLGSGALVSDALVSGKQSLVLVSGKAGLGSSVLVSSLVLVSPSLVLVLVSPSLVLVLVPASG